MPVFLPERSALPIIKSIGKLVGERFEGPVLQAVDMLQPLHGRPPGRRPQLATAVPERKYQKSGAGRQKTCVEPSRKYRGQAD